MGRASINSRIFLHMPSNTHAWIRPERQFWSPGTQRRGKGTQWGGKKTILIKRWTCITQGKYRGSYMVKADCGQGVTLQKGGYEREEERLWEARHEVFVLIFCFHFSRAFFIRRTRGSTKARVKAERSEVGTWSCLRGRSGTSWRGERIWSKYITWGFIF